MTKGLIKYLVVNAQYSGFVSKYLSSDSRVLDSLSLVNEEDMAGITHVIIFIDGESYRNLIEKAQSAGIKSRVINAGLTKVVNVDKCKTYDVYIGRGLKWGNPYAIGYSGDRDEVIRKYKYDFEREFLKFNKQDIIELKGKTLGCHCKPAACHGDLLVDYLNSLDDGA